MNAQQLVSAIEAAGKASDPKRTPDEFCRSANIHRATWQRIKAGKAPSYPSLIALQDLARQLGIDPHGPIPDHLATEAA